MATIYDVAERAGVSKSTVSRYLNNSTSVSDELKERVEKAIQELNYHPNHVARMLSNQKSNLIVLIIPYLSHHFFSKVAEEIDNDLLKLGYRLFIISAKNDTQLREDYLNVFKSFYIDGLIICNHALRLDSYIEYNIPMVSFERQLDDHIPWVSSDNYLGGKLATKHLIGSGCKKLGIIISNELLMTSGIERVTAFQDTCNRYNLSYETLTISLNSKTDQEKEEEIKAFLQTKALDGIFAITDDFGIATIRVAKQLGIDIPNELQVIGFDDIETAKIIQPELTTVRQNTSAIAKSIVMKLMNSINNKLEPSYSESIPVELIVRNSTK